MPLELIGLITLLVGAASLAAYALVGRRQRRVVIQRARGDSGVTPTARSVVIEDDRSVLSRLAGFLPESWTEGEVTQSRLIQAGFDGLTAPLSFATVRFAFLIGLPITAIALGPADVAMQTLFALAGAVIGWILPLYYLQRRTRVRQTTIRRSLPDALDLMVVCVEAGVSLDAAILRVARDMQLAHPELARELLIVNRRQNAGVTREEALRGMWHRTGVEEIRSLISSMIQSEKWGTSIATILRVSAETLRRKRRQIAEKKAATAPLKMLFPLMLFILPALFIVILGPAGMHIGALLRGDFSR